MFQRQKVGRREVSPEGGSAATRIRVYPQLFCPEWVRQSLGKMGVPPPNLVAMLITKEQQVLSKGRLPFLEPSSPRDAPTFMSSLSASEESSLL